MAEGKKKGKEKEKENWDNPNRQTNWPTDKPIHLALLKSREHTTIKKRIRNK